MLIKELKKEWTVKKRRMGCVSATQWICNRMNGYFPLKLTRILSNGEIYCHVVAFNGHNIIDLAKYADKPSNKR